MAGGLSDQTLETKLPLFSLAWSLFQDLQLYAFTCNWLHPNTCERLLLKQILTLIQGCRLWKITISTSDCAKRHHYIFDIWKLNRDVSVWPLRVHLLIKHCLIKATWRLTHFHGFSGYFTYFVCVKLINKRTLILSF